MTTSVLVKDERRRIKLNPIGPMCLRRHRHRAIRTIDEPATKSGRPMLKIDVRRAKPKYLGTSCTRQNRQNEMGVELRIQWSVAEIPEWCGEPFGVESKDAGRGASRTLA